MDTNINASGMTYHQVVNIKKKEIQKKICSFYVVQHCCRSFNMFINYCYLLLMNNNDAAVILPSDIGFYPLYILMQIFCFVLSI